ncbi:hypothetical protein Dalk_2719 [Desulfatibacillum aliphaticivorans]|uniref:Uncharacterized protein n=1 Tax=Desulfatibacillum aliphaticivorans TaxID=218208 RepID=B8FKN9_DESAL|nr:hypothetical protein [Desulfatibacillum aliphaticivorans]ACL04411.1 hypothetical protein Dalk_2719 [Desulfatibacillum aliphaticivorans]
MTPGDILKKCHSLAVAKTREMGDDYAELVFFRKDLDKWSQVLSENLGPAEKNENCTPSKEQQGLAKALGGVRHSQTLFARKGVNGTVVALYWPWRDKTHITLKLGLIP